MERATLYAEAEAAAEAGRWPAAIELFQQALEANDADAPSSASICEALAQCLMMVDDDAAAAARAERAVALAPAWADAWLTLGRARLNERR